MADDGSKQSTNVWPLPKFYFQVKWDSAVLSFEEVSGLDVEAQPIEYRHGDSPIFAPTKMPGLKKYGNVTMKKGVFKADVAATSVEGQEFIKARLLTGGRMLAAIWVTAWKNAPPDTYLKAQLLKRSAAKAP